MSTAAIVGVSLATIVLITVVALVWVSGRREKTPEHRLHRARRDQDKSRRWLAGGAAGGEGYSGCSGGGCGGGGGD